MRWSRTLSLYLVREVVQYTLLGLVAVTVLMGTRELIRVLDKLMRAGVQLEDLVTVLRLLATMLTVYALPVAFLFGVLLAVGRMASDAEITAMRSCGVGVLGTLVPVAILGLGFSLLTVEFTLELEPAARREMAAALRRMLLRGALVTPGQFKTIGDRTLYVDARERANRLRGVVISDRSDPERPFVIFAEAGRIQLDAEEAKLILRLERGNLHVVPRRADEERYRRVSFDRLEYELDVAGMLGLSRGRRAKEMSLAELRDTIKNINAGKAGSLRERPPSRYAANLQGRYAQIVAPLLFSILGLPLGMRRTRGARSLGVILCAVVAFVYYGLESFGEYLAGEADVVDARLALWLPDVIFAGVGLALLVRARRIL